MLCGVQAVVYTPYGGQTLVQASLLSPDGAWIRVFDATSRDVDLSTSAASIMPYVMFDVNPCRVTFLTDTVRLVFNTNLTQQWLGVSNTILE